ncbi:codanin-1 isoform X3 [Cylas formicarius]|nr:codanin-1 isoform X3 [Cylas formicarius]
MTSKSSTKKKKREQSLISNKSTRRITPTDASQKKMFIDLEKNENSFNFQTHVKEEVAPNADGRRSILDDRGLKILSRNKPTMLSKRSSGVNQTETVLLDEVTYKSNIDVVVVIYSALLDNKVVLNVIGEICFLISLLLIKNLNPGNNSQVSSLDNLSQETSFCNLDIFDTTQNVVYFASKCLERQLSILKCFDKTTLKLLAENRRLKKICPIFSRKLVSLAEKQTDTFVEVVDCNFQTNVCFNIDTDNKENFPDQTSFHSSKKQRDLFYDIFGIWERNHVDPEWNFFLSLGGKIKSLFGLCSDPANYAYMARLFKNQLLNSCAKNQNKERGLMEKQLNFIPNLGHIDADKLNRLTNRLVTKAASNSINSVPNFGGDQEFFEIFILTASNYSFNRHLADSIIADIIELNDSKLAVDRVLEVDTDTRKLYLASIKNLRLLAKFLGFLESLPYKSEYSALPKDVVEEQIKLRSQVCPPLDVKSLLNASIRSKTTILTIPWLVKYLAMLDYVTLRLPYYVSVNEILVQLYRNARAPLLVFCLGWLFELPHFPDGEYFSIHFEGVQCPTEQFSEADSYLDDLEIVGQNVLYLCCPYLDEIKKLLCADSSGNKVSVKHITPVSEVETSGDAVRKKLEQQLEEAFFNGQPASLRKTVEFVSERVASCAVKYICYTLVPEYKQTALDEFRSEIEQTYKQEAMDKHSTKEFLTSKSRSLARDHLNCLITSCEEIASRISREKIPPSMDGLLVLDVLPGTKKFCVDVASRMYADRVRQWVNSHVTVGLFLKDFDGELQRLGNWRRNDKSKLVFQLPPGGRPQNHDEDAKSGFYILDDIREMCCHVIEEDKTFAPNCVSDLLRNTLRGMKQRNDVNDIVLSNIHSNLFDLFLILAAKRSETVDDSVMKLFVEIWQTPPTFESTFKTLFSARNVHLMSRSPSPTKSWGIYATLVPMLVETKCLSVEEFESQCTGFYKRNWDQDVLEQFSNFLKRCASSQLIGSKISAFLDFLSDFCSDL